MAVRYVLGLRSSTSAREHPNGWCLWVCRSVTLVVRMLGSQCWHKSLQFEERHSGLTRSLGLPAVSSVGRGDTGRAVEHNFFELIHVWLKGNAARIMFQVVLCCMRCGAWLWVVMCGRCGSGLIVERCSSGCKEHARSRAAVWPSLQPNT